MHLNIYFSDLFPVLLYISINWSLILVIGSDVECYRKQMIRLLTISLYYTTFWKLMLSFKNIITCILCPAILGSATSKNKLSWAAAARFDVIQRSVRFWLLQSKGYVLLRNAILTLSHKREQRLYDVKTFWVLNYLSFICFVKNTFWKIIPLLCQKNRRINNKKSAN